MMQMERNHRRLRILRILHMEHLLFQQNERNHYYHRRNLACVDPENFTSMICDAMAQASCKIPRKLHYEYAGRLMEQKLVGVLVHGPQQ